MEQRPAPTRLTRRTLLSGLALSGAALALGALSACGPKATPQAENRPAPGGSAATSVAATGSTAASASAVVKGQTMAIAIWGGPFSKTIREAILPDFEKDHGIRVAIEEGITADALAKIRTAREKPQHTIIGIDDQFVPEVKAEGLVVQLTPHDVSNMKDMYPQYIVEEGYGVGAAVSWFSPAYNSDKIKTDPGTWAALWDPAYKGRVIMVSLKAGTGIMQFLAAAAVATGKPIKEAQYDADAAFKKMKELKPNVLKISDSTVQDIPLLAQGEAWILPTPSRLAFPYKLKGAPIERLKPKEGSFMLLNTVALVKNAPLQAQGKDFINRFIALKAQLDMSKGALTGPTNKNVEIPADLKGLVPGPEDASQMIRPDWEFVIKNRSAWIDRWNKEIAS